MRLIDADALIDEIIEYKQIYIGDPYSHIQHDLQCDGAISWIDGASTVDAVPVVRCKDCSVWTQTKRYADNVGWCRYAGWVVGKEGYCVYAVRKESADK